MKIHIQVVIECEPGVLMSLMRSPVWEREALQPEIPGLTLAEAKDVLQGVQQVLVPHQVAEYVEHLAGGQTVDESATQRAPRPGDPLAPWPLVRVQSARLHL